MQNEEPILCDPEDWAAIQKVLAGDFESFEQLVLRYESMVYSQAKKAFRNESEAEDFTQDIFLKAFEGLSTFKGRSKFSTWVFSIARNEIIRKYRKDHPEIDMPIDGISSDVASAGSSSQESEVLERETTDKIRSLVEKLPELYRKPISLHYFENMSYKDISENLNLKMNTLKSYIFRGKEILREWLKKEDEHGKK
ncbi:RNA polymerase sigma factor [Leptospira wolffii]|uniref:RNA polymerase sigma factor n=1 Tax=Leptospira wolffii TaxID=409998 RepID=UPI0010828B48|nr:RNA polymerase sigma factor [Leptospira wolffii]TGK62059.1 RNA polymerase sigma factor [Leptospira wolffii]TGK68661.1 RNA polymerase sigma factor [Leptospira wolffii]TGK74555.1 RNA polymerase sigma factor [Leptospira wolffii]TGL31869.1 RNA polymerase sigma factor [Leptospira wolffii]